jgi:hypothetical protein
MGSAHLRYNLADKGDRMRLANYIVWFLVAAAHFWDIRRTRRQSQAIVEQVKARAARIDAIAERILRITP